MSVAEIVTGIAHPAFRSVIQGHMFFKKKRWKKQTNNVHNREMQSKNKKKIAEKVWYDGRSIACRI